jgi:ATP-binding cassette subfamily B multidrug efflux pump
VAEKSGLKTIFFKYFNRYLKYWIIGLITVVGASGLAVLMPLILKKAVDAIESGGTAEALLSWALAIVGIAVGKGIFNFFALNIITTASIRIEYDLHNDLLRHFENLDQSFYREFSTGDLVSRASNDVDAVKQMYGPGFFTVANAVFIVPLSFILMYRVDLQLTAYSLMALPVLTVVVFILGKMLFRRYRKVQRRFGELSGYARENLEGIKVVHSFVQDRYQTKRFDELNIDYIRKFMSMTRVWAMIFPVIYFITGILLLIVLYVGGGRVINNTLTLGSFVAFIAYLAILVWPLVNFGWMLGNIQRGFASLARIKRILDWEPKVISHDGEYITDRLTGEIEFRNLNFRYNGQPVLKDISFKVQPGQRVAVVGATGSGKSTLVSLLARIYPVPDGCLFIDGKDVNRFDIGTLRSNIGFIPQDTFLFSDSISENITYGSDPGMRTHNGHPDEEIKRVAEMADLLKDVEKFPKEFDTVVGERGSALSGGQKQRTSIARAIINKPPIIVFDDALSAVDTDTEKKILDNLRNALQSCTVFLISHRISTVMDADLIIALDDGRLVESGDHHSLMAHKGYYAQLYRKQLLAEELESI